MSGKLSKYAKIVSKFAKKGFVGHFWAKFFG